MSPCSSTRVRMRPCCPDPRSQSLGITGTGERYRLVAFDGTTHESEAVRAVLVFLNKTLRGRFLQVESEVGVIGRNVLNRVRLLLDGPDSTGKNCHRRAATPSPRWGRSARHSDNAFYVVWASTLDRTSSVRSPRARRIPAGGACPPRLRRRCPATDFGGLTVRAGRFAGGLMRANEGSDLGANWVQGWKCYPNAVSMRITPGLGRKAWKLPGLQCRRIAGPK